MGITFAIEDFMIDLDYLILDDFNMIDLDNMSDDYDTDSIDEFNMSDFGNMTDDNYDSITILDNLVTDSIDEFNISDFDKNICDNICSLFDSLDTNMILNDEELERELILLDKSDNDSDSGSPIKRRRIC